MRGLAYRNLSKDIYKLHLLCYHNESDASVFTSLSHSVVHVNCYRACLAYGDNCFCQTDFSWTFEGEPIPELLNITCENFICKKSQVVHSYTTQEFCVEPSKSAIFRFRDIFNSSALNHFARIGNESSNTFDQILFQSAYPRMNGTSFTYVFGDGYVNTTDFPKTFHIYEKVSTYLAQIIVKSELFPNFTYTRSIKINFPVLDIQLESCSTDYYIIKNDLKFNCSGFVTGGSSVIKVFGDYSEDEPEELRIISTTAFEIPSPYFPHAVRIILPYYYPKVYHQPDTKFQYDGSIYKITFYAATASSGKFQVYRTVSEDVYFLVHSFDLNFKNGYNIIDFEKTNEVQKGDSVGFFLDDANNFHIIEYPGSTLNVYQQTSDGKLDGSILDTQQNKSFHFRVFACTISRFYMGFDLKYSGMHHIQFYIMDQNFKKAPNTFRVDVVSYQPTIENPVLIPAVVEQHYNACLKIDNANQWNITWSTTNKNILLYKDSISAIPFVTESYVLKSSAKQIINACIVLIFQQHGNYSVNVTLSISNYITAENSLSIEVLPKITGLAITTSIKSHTIFQLQPVTFQGIIDPYPFLLTVTWNFGNDLTKTQLSDQNLSNSMTYTNEGDYNITMSATYASAYEEVVYPLKVLKSFEIRGANLISTVEELVLNIDVKITVDVSLWDFTWDFGDNTTKYLTSGSASVKKNFAHGGTYNITLQIRKPNGDTLLEYFICRVIEPITALEVRLKEGNRALPYVNFTVEATYDSGNNVTYFWSSTNSQKVSENRNEATFFGNKVGQTFVNLTATNALYNSSFVLSLFLSNPLTHFSVVPSSLFVTVRSVVTFIFTTKGGAEVSYEIRYENVSFSISESVFEKVFTKEAQFHLQFTILLGKQKDKCLEISLVPCTISLLITAEYLIEDFQFLYQNSRGEQVSTQDIAYSLTKKELPTKVIAYPSSSVVFSMFLQGAMIRGIKSLPNFNGTFAEVLFSHVNFWNAGLYHLHIKAVNFISEVSRNITIVINDLISNLEVFCEEHVELNSTFVVSANIKSGTNVTYELDYNGTLFYTFVPTFLLRAHNRGFFNLSVRAFNPSSELTEYKTVQIILSVEKPFVGCPVDAYMPGSVIKIPFGFQMGELVTVSYSITNMELIGNDIDLTNNNTEPIENNLNPSKLALDQSGPIEFMFPISFPSPGQYSINFTFENPAYYEHSQICNIRIEDAVNSLSMIIHPKTGVFTGDKVTFLVKVFGGSNLKGQLLIETQKHITVQLFALLLKPCINDDPALAIKYALLGDCLEANISYIFDIGNHYHITGSVWNQVCRVGIPPQDITIIGVSQGVHEYLEIVADSTIINTPTNIHFIRKGQIALLECVLKLGDGNVITTTTFGSIFQYTYNQTGQYNIQLECFTDKGFVNVTALAFVQIVLGAVDIMYPEFCVLFGDVVKIATSLLHINMVFLIRIDVFIDDVNIKAEIDITGRNITIDIPRDVYETSGEHKIFTVIIKNYVSEISKKIPICIMKAVNKIASQTPVVWRYGIETIFQVTIDSESTAQLIINFGDSSSQILKGVSKEIRITHLYKDTGLLYYNIVAKNNVSSLQINGSIEIIHVLENVTLFHTKQLKWPSNTLQFTLHFAETPIENFNYHIHYGDGDSTRSILNATNVINNEITFITHSYPSPSCYDVSITVFTKINSITLRSKVFITRFDVLSVLLNGYSNQESDIVLRDNYPLRLSIKNGNGMCVTYQVSLYDREDRLINAITTTETDILIDALVNKPGQYLVNINASMGEETKQIARIPFQLFIGLPTLSILLEPKKSVNHDREFLILVKSNVEVIPYLYVDFGDGRFINITRPNLLNVNGNLIGKQYLGYHSFFKIAHSYETSGSFQVTVSSKNQVSQTSATMTILISTVHCERPGVEILTSGEEKRLTFHYQNTINILSSTWTDCEWMNKILFTWKTYLSNVWEFENMISSDMGAEISLSGVELSDSTLNIPRRSLDAGYYIVRLSIELESNKLENFDEIFLRVIEDDIKAIISGGSAIQLSWQESIHLNASQSTDPNEVSAQLEYEWYCVMPLYENTKLGEVVTENKDCFGIDSTNEVKYFGEVWTIPPKVLLEGVEYLFEVVVKNVKNSREARTKQSIVLLDKKLPILTLSCQSNCGKYTNPSKRFVVVADCSNCQDASTKYQWSCDMLDLQKVTLSNPNSRSLLIKAGAFAGDKIYTFLLTVMKESGVSALSRYEIKTSRPPHGGKCSVFPETGFALKTTFTISCSKWQSPIGSLNYRIMRKVSSTIGKTDYQLLQHGPQATVNLLLGSGEKVNDYVVNITIEILDMYDVSTAYEEYVKVIALSTGANENEVQEELLNLTTGGNSMIKKLSDEGNTQGLIQMISSITDTLNAEDKHDKHNSTYREDTLSKRKKMRAAMAETLSDINVNSYNSVKQTADVIGPLVEKSEEISMETQEFALKSMSNVVKYLQSDEELIEERNPEKIEAVTGSVIKATGNLLQAVVLNGGNGTNNETKDVSKSENFTRNALKIIDQTSPMLLYGKLPGEEPTRIANEAISIELSRSLPNDLRNTSIETMNGGRIQLPQRLFSSEKENSIVDSKMSTLSKNPFLWHISAVDISAPVSSLSFTGDNNKALSVSQLPEDDQIEYFVPQSAVVSTIKVNSTLLKSLRTIVYRLKIEKNGAYLLVRPICNKGVILHLYLSRGKRPTPEFYHETVTVTCGNEQDYSIMSTWPNTTTYFVGLRLNNINNEEEPGASKNGDLLMNIEFFATGCLYLDEINEIWLDKGCKVGPKTTPSRTHCLCNHLTWLGSSFFIPPNDLDLENTILKLKHLDDYPALLATFCVMVGVMLICSVWARRKDVRDQDKCQPIYLKSQSVRVGVTYHIAIFTGHRGGSGTSATPTLILSGEEIDTISITLKSEEKKLFVRGSVETFLFTIDKDLGELKYITIWHDDGGDDPAWFLSRIIITNLSDNRQFYCFCNDWLAVDQSDGKISRVLPVACEEELKAFENIFLAKTARDLTDGHIWFSIMTKPPRSNFTRLQRVFCCLSLLLSTMLTNAMFYKVNEGKPAGDEIDISGFVIKWSNILIGIQSAVIVLPINVLMVILFRKARPYSSKEKRKEKKLRKAEETIQTRNRPVSYGEVTQVESGSHRGKLSSNLLTEKFSSKRHIINDSVSTIQDSNQFQITCKIRMDDVQLSYDSMVSSNSKTDHEEIFLGEDTQFQLDEVQYWPHWLVYVAWVLCVLVSIIAGFFTLLYGLKFGREGQEKWLFSFFVSIVSDIMVNQPIKVVLFAAVVTLVVRKLNDDYIITEIENFRNIHLTSELGTVVVDDSIEKSQRSKPPSRSYIEMTRKKRIYEAKMVDVVIEIVAYCFYLFLCLLITYGHRDPDAYMMTKNIENIFYTEKFDQVNSIPTFWDWTLNVLSPNLFNDHWYNGKIIEQKGFLSDGSSFLLGATRIRQVRVKNEFCPTYGMYGLNTTLCGKHFLILHEETINQYCERWKLCKPMQPLPIYPNFWRYQNSEKSGSYSTIGRVSTYPGGGYIVDIGRSKLSTDSSLRYLQRNNWLDKNTRSVFVDFTIYNTNANFYVMVMFLLEVPANGGASTFRRILTTRLDRYSSGFAVFLGVCEVLFLCFSLYYIYREALKMFHLKGRYFKDWKNWLEIISVALIWTTFGLLIVRFGVVAVVKSEYFREPGQFVNFESAALSDQMYGYILALVVSMLFVKFLKLLRFNRRMSMMFQTLSYGSKDIRYFSITFVIIVGAFAQMAYFLYHPYVQDYSGFIRTLESLLNLALGSYDYDDLTSSHPLIGKIFFASYIATLHWILLNMFISIINEAFNTIEKRVKTQKNKYELVDFLIQRIHGYLPAYMTRKKVEEEKGEKEDPESSNKAISPLQGILAYPKSEQNGSIKAVIWKDQKKTNQVNLGKTKSLSKFSKEEQTHPKYVSMNSTEYQNLNKRVERCESYGKVLDTAVDRIVEITNFMLQEEEAEERMWEHINELIQIEFC